MMLSVYVTMPDGTVKEFSANTVLNDGTCLIRDGEQFYHTVVGCNGEFSDWKLTTIDEAEKSGLLPCLICEDVIRDLQDFDGNF